MTANQIAYQRNLEDMRANQEREKENYRSNVAKESETNRHNLADELNTYRNYMENARSNLAQEAIGRANVGVARDRNEETLRHNVATENHSSNALAAELASTGVKINALDLEKAKQRFYEKMSEAKFTTDVVDGIWDDVLDLLKLFK